MDIEASKSVDICVFKKVRDLPNKYVFREIATNSRILGIEISLRSLGVQRSYGKPLWPLTV